jgi:ATP-binding cassette subfamily F protein uup
MQPIRMLVGRRAQPLAARADCSRVPPTCSVLDEPTNDLDIDSLELLETMLVDYSAHCCSSSHDRTFLDNVVTQTIASRATVAGAEYVGRLQRLAAAAFPAARGEQLTRRRTCTCARPGQAQAQLQGTA